MQKNYLAGIQVVVTRPEHQAQQLCEMITEQGGRVIRLPTIRITPLLDTDDQVENQSQARLFNPEYMDYAVFISPNAVEYGIARLLAHGEIPDKLKLVTIGKASARKVRQLIGREPDIYPTEQYNSESLLELDDMQSAVVNNKRIVIFRGRGGRELLATTLKQRGAKVDYAEVYQRLKPEPDKEILGSILLSDKPMIITLTSNEGLNNMVAMFAAHYDESQLHPLWQKPLVVVTEPMRENARKSGFSNKIVVAAKASNEALLESIQEWVNYTFNR